MRGVLAWRMGCLLVCACGWPVLCIVCTRLTWVGLGCGVGVGDILGWSRRRLSSIHPSTVQCLVSAVSSGLCLSACPGLPRESGWSSAKSAGRSTVARSERGGLTDISMLLERFAPRIGVVFKVI